MECVTDLLICLRIDDIADTCHIIIVLKTCNNCLKRDDVLVELIYKVLKSQYRRKSRNLDLGSVGKCEFYIIRIRHIDTVLSEDRVAGVTGFSLITFVSCCLTVLFPLLLIVVADVPLAILDLELRSKTVVTCCPDLSSVLVKKPLIIHSPVPVTVCILLCADNRVMAVLTVLAVIYRHVTGECKTQNIAQDCTVFAFDRRNLGNIVILLQCLYGLLESIDIIIDSCDLVYEELM